MLPFYLLVFLWNHYDNWRNTLWLIIKEGFVLHRTWEMTQLCELIFALRRNSHGSSLSRCKCHFGPFFASPPCGPSWRIKAIYSVRCWPHIGAIGLSLGWGSWSFTVSVCCDWFEVFFGKLSRFYRPKGALLSFGGLFRDCFSGRYWRFSGPI